MRIHIFAILLSCCGSVLAVPPANDNFISAEVLTGTSATTTGTTVGATATTNPSDETYSGELGTSGTVWYEWTAPAGVTVARISISFVGAPGECTVRTGPSSSILVGGMAQYSSAVKAAGWKSFLFKTTPGTEYRIKVASENGSRAGSNFSLSLLANPGFTLPVNDTKASPTILPSQQNITTSGSFQNATSDENEGYYTDNTSMKFTNSAAAIWYRWLAPTTGYYGINLIGQKNLQAQIVKLSDSSTLIYEYVDSLNGFYATAGVTYSIKVVSDIGGDFYTGNFQLILAPRPYADKFVSESPPRPLNQSLNYQLAGSTASASGKSSAPTYSPGIPNVYCYLTTYPLAITLLPGVWEIGGYDPSVIRVTVFHESATYNYSAVATSHSSGSTRFTASGMNAYYAEISLANPENALTTAALSGTLTLQQIPANNIPANDSFANATVLNSQPITTAKGTTVGASGEISEDFSEIGESVTRDIASRSVWYRWTPLSDATHYLVALDEENKPLHLRITTGALGALGNLGADQELRDIGIVVSTATTYSICVDDEDRSCTGNFRLFIGKNLSFDSFAGRQLLTKNGAGIASWRNGSSLGMTREIEPDINGIGHTAWFEYRADSSTPLYINTFGSSYDTHLHVYTGNSLGSLISVASNDDFDASSNRNSALTFTPVTGTFYQIRVAGYGDQKGIFNLQIGQQPSSWKPYVVWALNYDWGSLSQSESSDPDMDGLTNLEECVFGGHPLIRESRRSPAPISSQGSLPPYLLTPPYFGIQYGIFSQNLVGQGIGTPITVTPQSSVDLLTWQTVSSSLSSGVLTATVSNPVSTNGKIFLRTKITSNP